MITIREKNTSDNKWISDYLCKNWSGDFIITRGKRYTPLELRGFIAEENGEAIGISLYVVVEEKCEIVLLEAFTHYRGIGTELLNRIKEQGREEKWTRIWLITTNDNIGALRFYQRRGFIFCKLYRNAIEASRRIKPTIPDKGNYGIVIRDEIELEYIGD
jgi:ribosomal protein S18 acetylase RimI-like enzyme